jgi:hypothetical protein
MIIRKRRKQIDPIKYEIPLPMAEKNQLLLE